MILYLFDIDGTILLTGGAGSRAINDIFLRRYGVDDAMRTIDPGGKTDPLIFGEIFEGRLGRPPDDDEIDDILDEYVPLLEREIAASERFHTMPAAVETVTYLSGRADVTLGIATGNVRGAARAKLQHIDLWDVFEFGGFGCDSADRGELVARAIERAHNGDRSFDPDHIVVVGDTVRDIAAARACGVQALAVSTGSTSRETLAAADPDQVFETLAELPRWHEARF